MFEALNAQSPDSLLGLIKAFNSDGRAGENRPRRRGLPRRARRHPGAEGRQGGRTDPARNPGQQEVPGPRGRHRLRRIVEALHIRGRATGSTAGSRRCRRPAARARCGSAPNSSAPPTRQAAVRVGTPTWPNHAPIFTAAGLAIEAHRFADLEGAKRRLRRASGKGSPRRRPATSSCCTAAATTRPGSISPAISGRRSPKRLRRESSCLSSTSPTRASETGSTRTRGRPGSSSISVEEALVAYSCDKNFGALPRPGRGAVRPRSQRAARPRR